MDDNALVDMYAKCGLLKDAYDVVEDIPIQNVEAWKTLIIGYSNMNIVRPRSLVFNQCVGRTYLQMKSLSFVSSRP